MTTFKQFLIDPLLVEKKLSIPQSQKNTTGILKSPNLVHLGTGMTAIAYLHKKFPSKVVKTINISGENDPACHFLRICVNHQNNPYFPKIHAYKQYNTTEFGNWDDIDVERDQRYQELHGVTKIDYPPQFNYYQLIIVMEKLYPLKGNDSAALPILQELGILPQDLTTIEKTTNFKGEEVDTDPLDLLSTILNNPIERKRLRQIAKDPFFNQAMKLLEPLLIKHAPDMHHGNIMLRKSPDGPHLVIIDPVVELLY